MNGFIDHLYTPLRTTSNYSATANLHNSRFTTAGAKPFLACRVSTYRPLATASNSGDSSASCSHSRSEMPASYSPWSRSQESGSELLYDWRFTAHQFVLATSRLRLTASIFSFQLNTCGYSPYVTRLFLQHIGTSHMENGFHFYSPTTLRFLFAYSLSRERVYRAVAYQWTSVDSSMLTFKCTDAHTETCARKHMHIQLSQINGTKVKIQCSTMQMLFGP
jgi:hypothetical protein